MSFCFFCCIFWMASFFLDTQITFMCRTLVRSLPHKWRRVVQQEVALRRYWIRFHLMIFVSFTCQFFLFSQACFFPALDLFCCFGSFVWLSTHLDVNLGEQNITQGRLSYSANPHWLTETLRPLWHSRITCRKLIFLKENSLFLMSPSNWFE